MPIDIVLLDLDLSDAQGFSVVEQACAAHPGVPSATFVATPPPLKPTRVAAFGSQRGAHGDNPVTRTCVSPLEARVVHIATPSGP